MSLDRTLLDRAHALVDALEGAHVESVSAVDGTSTTGLLAAIDALGDLSRTVDALGAVFSAEVTRRTQTDAAFRREALGGEVGGRLASELLRERTRLDSGLIRDWDAVGAAIAPRTTLQGEPLPARHEPVVSAVLGASITARAAAIVVRGVDAIAPFGDADTVASIECTLVECAGSLTTRELSRLTRQVSDRFDPDGAEPREELLRARSKVTLRELPNGLTRLIADLHPEAAGLVRTALDAQTAPRRQVSFVDAGASDGAADPDVDPAADLATTDAATADLRPLAEKRVDALATMARDFLARDTGSLAGTAVTMLVTVPLETLHAGRGTAQIAGVDEPISASTARRLAASAEIIPVVLGSCSEVLDLGRSQRLFSEAQRRALAARDGGCVWPGCSAPPAWCEVAHLLAWILGGLTDLENGALMCAHHHRQFDHDGWQLEWRDGTPYLIPPPWLDAARTPRRAGHLALAA